MSKRKYSEVDELRQTLAMKNAECTSQKAEIAVLREHVQKLEFQIAIVIKTVSLTWTLDGRQP